jgi:thioredoxin-related protein
VGESVFRGYGVQGIPTICIVDRQGAIRYQEAGFSRDMKTKLAAVIDGLLEP